jgi:hypothetical protein
VGNDRRSGGWGGASRCRSRGAGWCRSAATGSGQALLETSDPLGQRRHGGIGVEAGEADECDLERNARVEGVLDPHERLAEQFERTGGAHGAQAGGLFDRAVTIGVGEPGEISAHGGEEDIAEAGDEGLTEHTGAATAAERCFHRNECTSGVTLAERLDQFVDSVVGVGDSAGGDDPIEGRQGVAG